MSLDQDVTLLKSIPLFADFSAEQLRLIAFSAEPLNLAAGTILFREGAPADSGYVVVSGAVALSVERDGEERELEVAGPGALIGEVALLCQTTRPAMGRTVERTELLAVSRRLLKRVLQEYPEMAVRLREALSERLLAMTSDLAVTRERLLAIEGPETGGEAMAAGEPSSPA